MDIENFVVGKDTSIQELEKIMLDYEKLLKLGKQVAFVIEKGAPLDLEVPSKGAPTG